METRARAEPGRRLLLASLLVLAFLLGCFPMADFDVWWHLRAGQAILQSGSLPRVDDWTYTNAGRPWIDLYWLFQVVIAVLYKVGGSSALVLLKASAGTAVVALALRARRRGAPAWAAAVAWLPALVALSGRLCERPEVFSLLLLAGFLVVLAHAEEYPGRLWILPLLQVVWVNCHGFFVLGPLLLSAYWADLLYRRLRLRLRPALGKVVLPSAATLLACLASPYGARAVALPVEQFHKLGSSGIYRANIGELKTVGDFIAVGGIKNPYLLSVFALFFLGVLTFVLQMRRGPLHPFRVLVFLAASYLGWQATRNSSLYALIAATVICWNLDDEWQRLASVKVDAAPRGRRRSGPREGPRKVPRNWNHWLLGAVCGLGLLTLSGGLYAWAREGRTVGLGERRRWYAHDACAFLARPDFPERIIAFNLGQAAVCIEHAAPAHKVFMDPRLEVNAEETFERYLTGLRRLWRGDADWETPIAIDYARPAELPALLIERGVLARAADMLSRDLRWRCVYADSVAVVFVPTAFADAHDLAAVAR